MRCTSDDKGLTPVGLKRLYADERGNAKRIVLLVVLLLVLAAAAVFLLFPDLISPPSPEPAKPVKAQVKRKVVQLPKKPAAKPAAQKPAAQKATEQKATEQKATEQKATEQKAAAQQATAQQVAAQQAAEQKATEQKATEQQAAAQKAAAQKAAAQKAAAQQAAAQKAAAQPRGPYTVTAGAYLMKSSVALADKSVSGLGYTPYHSEVKRDIEVIRLKEGTYGEAEARARVAQYKREMAPEAFALKGTKGWSVYLGSYVGLDRARVHADRLYAHGVRVSEEKAVVPMTLTLVRFGDFADQAAAAKVVVKAKAAGLEAYVSKVK